MTSLILLIGSFLLVIPNSYKHVFVYIYWSKIMDSPSDCPLVTTPIVQLLSSVLVATISLLHFLIALLLSLHLFIVLLVCILQGYALVIVICHYQQCLCVQRTRY
jgi:hypothetical protein